MIAKHNELLAFVETENAAHDERMKPFNDAIGAIKNACLAFLQEQNAQNFKTDDGTAYQVTTMSVKVDNPAAFLDFVIKDKHPEFLSPQVLKDPVRDWLDKSNGVPPPGVKIDFFTKCNIRRS
jgi:hypothetical protein